MSDSIQERIVKKVAAAMASITVANGYNNTIKSVQRYRWSGIDLNNLPTIMIVEGTCDVELLKSTHERIRRRLELYIVVAVPDDEVADARPGAEILSYFAADIEKRLGASQQWDGLALMTEPPSYTELSFADAETPHLARGLRTEIVYEHVRSDPFTQ
jgi:hypothetical protein